ncbi:transcriptional regulator, TetR family [Lachnospiraceae bacterium XPB1003]|nr:transcriptional regulator, TetR family [Lachnospiraceae bacterium XPB1003]
MTTRDKILEEALRLFSEKGYDGTSVESIAEAVGIKAPSLYKHFKGKEDILNCIIDVSEKRYSENFGSAHSVGKLPGSKEEFLKLSIERFSYTLNDPNIRRIRIFLTQEQFRNKRMADITNRHQMEDVQSLMVNMLGGMMETGVVKKDDPRLLAVELASPAVLMVSESDRLPDKRDEILKKFEEHIRHFCDVYFLK